MSPPPAVTAAAAGPSMITRVAAVAVVLALAALAAYALFSGPTKVPAPVTPTTQEAAPAKVAPATGEDSFEGKESGDGR